MQNEQVQQELEQEQTYMVGNTTFIVAVSYTHLMLPTTPYV